MREKGSDEPAAVSAASTPEPMSLKSASRTIEPRKGVGSPVTSGAANRFSGSTTSTAEYGNHGSGSTAPVRSRCRWGACARPSRTASAPRTASSALPDSLNIAARVRTVPPAAARIISGLPQRAQVEQQRPLLRVVAQVRGDERQRRGVAVVLVAEQGAALLIGAALQEVSDAHAGDQKHEHDAGHERRQGLSGVKAHGACGRGLVRTRALSQSARAGAVGVSVHARRRRRRFVAMLQRQRVNASAASAAVQQAVEARSEEPTPYPLPPWPRGDACPMTVNFGPCGIKARDEPSDARLALVDRSIEWAAMPRLHGAARTVARLTEHVRDNALLGAALRPCGPEGETLFESLVGDVEGLRYVACDGALTPEVELVLVTQLEAVAAVWMRGDLIHVPHEARAHDLHMRRMRVLREVESLLIAPHVCTTWANLGLAVAVMEEERRHRHGLKPLVAGAGGRVVEARARLLVRLTVQSVLVRAQACAETRSDMRALCTVVLLWVGTTHGLRLFARALNHDQRQAASEAAGTDAERAQRQRKIAHDVATAVETNLLSTLQSQPGQPDGDRLHRLHRLALLAGSGGPALDEQWAAVVQQEHMGCLDVVGLDVGSERLRLRLKAQGGRLVKGRYGSGMAAGLMTCADGARVG